MPFFPPRGHSQFCSIDSQTQMAVVSLRKHSVISCQQSSDMEPPLLCFSNHLISAYFDHDSTNSCLHSPASEIMIIHFQIISNLAIWQFAPAINSKEYL